MNREDHLIWLIFFFLDFLKMIFARANKVLEAWSKQSFP